MAVRRDRGRRRDDRRRGAGSLGRRPVRATGPLLWSRGPDHRAARSAPLRTPIGIAPTSLQRAAHPYGERAMAAGARRAGALHVVSSNAGHRFVDIDAGSPWWIQIYLPPDRASAALVLRAAVAAGATAVVLTVDTPVPGPKLRPPEEDWDATRRRRPLRGGGRRRRLGVQPRWTPARPRGRHPLDAASGGPTRSVTGSRSTSTAESGPPSTCWPPWHRG